MSGSEESVTPTAGESESPSASTNPQLDSVPSAQVVSTSSGKRLSSKAIWAGIALVIGLLALLQLSGRLDGSPEVGAEPVAVSIEMAGVDAPIEQADIIDGVMEDPSGPWVVAWYTDTGWLGERGNVVLAGHFDYWDVGPAVFYHVGGLQPGDEIVVGGEDGVTYLYRVDWVRNYMMASISPEEVNSIVIPDDRGELITLITCGGQFDYASGDYLERTIIRGHREKV